MIYNPITRRFFLQGAGSLMALPLLPSLIPKAHAASNDEINKFFVMVGSGHGGVGHSTDWYPEPFINKFDGNWLKEQKLFPSIKENDLAHIIRHAKLRGLMSADPGHPNGNVDMGQERLSYILGSFFNPYIDKMNFIVGIDGAMSYYGHSKGVYGGNAWNSANDESGNPNSKLRWETIDRFFSRSSKFYKNLENVSLPVSDFTRDMSYTQDGASTPRRDNLSIGNVYNQTFSKFEKEIDPKKAAAEAKEKLLIDLVIDDYKRITKGAYGLARRISSEEKKMIESHVEHLYETQKKAKSLINSCSDVAMPNVDEKLRKGDDAEKYWDTVTDLLVAGFQCGATKIGVLAGNDHFRYKGDYHQEVAHAASSDPEKQYLHNKSFRWTSKHLVHNLVKKLDNIELSDGKTLLDKGMVMWVHESGDVTHGHTSVGLTTFGSVDGYFKTGNLVDYRNLLNAGVITWYKKEGPRPGVPLPRLLANVAQAYGHSPSDYRRFGRPGYGDSSKFKEGRTNVKYAHLKPDLLEPYPKHLRDSLDDKLPIIT